jgi:polynucleotide 5'-kinase involved in rRNA processing
VSIQKTEGSWDRRGMVVGHVQSGKTSNYVGLINKATDAGYKVFIVVRLAL